MFWIKPVISTKIRLPLYLARVPAGFPSPAEDHLDRHLDLNEYLIKKPSSTFFAKAEGDSMVDFGIHDGSILIVDRSAKARHGAIVVVCVNGELTCKQLDTHGKQLVSGNRKFRPIPIGDDIDAIVEGVVLWSIKSHA
jgi:DNA polymerase V